jgi:hypothetical protein
VYPGFEHQAMRGQKDGMDIGKCPSLAAPISSLEGYSFCIDDKSAVVPTEESPVHLRRAFPMCGRRAENLLLPDTLLRGLGDYRAPGESYGSR